MHFNHLARILLGISLFAFEFADQGSALAQVEGEDGEKTIRSTDFGNWKLRETREYIGDPRRRAVPFRTRYYLTSIDSDKETLAYEMTGTYAKQIKTVLNNGTLVLAYGNTVTWVDREGEESSERLVIEGVDFSVARCWPDFAVLAKERRDSRGTALYAVALTDSPTLDLAKSVPLTKDDGVWYSRGYLERRGNTLVWLEFSPDENGMEFGECAIRTFDFETQTQQHLPFDEYGIKMPDGGQIKEFDGRRLTIHDSRRRFTQVLDLNSQSVLIEGYELSVIGQREARQIVAFWKAREGARSDMRDYYLCSIVTGADEADLQQLWSKTLSRFSTVEFSMEGDRIEISDGKFVETIVFDNDER